MKILAVGCIHGDILKVRKLAEKAEKEEVDLVVLCGDLTYADTSSENLIGPFLKKNKKVVFVPGNHDSIATMYLLQDLYKITNLHGNSVNIKGIGFFGCGGAPYVGPNLTITEEEIFDKLKKGHDKIKFLSKKVMVTHAHPKGSIGENLAHPIIKASKSIRKAIDQFKPNLLLYSHVHEAQGIEEIIGSTKLINVCKEGVIVNI
ncbi:metallophosphoesterase family protein [Candidatus Woesearchaeota archaeon]|nr:metallophosphoesterase family protein [Candidatus Woesearchaeota archaeon]